MLEDTAGGSTTLGAEMRDVARARILRGARSVLVRRGLDATVDEVAVAAGVSRRTVFRYFPSHAQLLDAAMTDIWDIYGRQLPEAPRRGDDIDAWLMQTATTLHALNVNLVGRAFWDVQLECVQGGPFTDVAGRIVAGAQRFVDRITLEVWRASGGRRQPPSWLVDAFALHLSAFATHGLASGHPERTPEDLGRISASMLSTLLRAALVQQAH